MEKVSLNNFIHQYELKPEVIQNLKVTKDKLITSHTIEIFLQYHGDDYKHLLYSIKNSLHDIRKQEKIILFNGKKIYFHTYNILFIIFRYLKALDFYNSEKYKKTYAGLRGSEAEVLDKYHTHRANIFDSSNSFTGDDKIKALVFRNLYIDRETTDLFVNFYTLYPKNMYKVNSDEIFIKKIIDKIIEHFGSTYIASEDIIYKSLAICLNAYFRLKMKIQAKYAKKVTEDILVSLFDYKFSASSADLLRNIYISGRLSELPIFKHAKQSHELNNNTIENFNKMFTELKENFIELENFSTDAEAYFQENPIKQFLLLFPMEFLQEIE